MYTHVCAIHVYGLYTQVLDQLPFFWHQMRDDFELDEEVSDQIQKMDEK